MAWLNKDASQRDIGHTLDDARGFGLGKQHWALCGIALDPDAEHLNELPRCATCQAEWDKLRGRRRTRGHAAKLPRCICPTCGSEHILRTPEAQASPVSGETIEGQ